MSMEIKIEIGKAIAIVIFSEEVKVKNEASRIAIAIARIIFIAKVIMMKT